MHPRAGRSWRARQVLSFVAASLLVFVLASTVIGIRLTLDELDSLREKNRENITWLLSQTELEHQRYLVEVLLALGSDLRDAEHVNPAIRDAFDIYFSRVESVRRLLGNVVVVSPLREGTFAALNEIVAYRDDLAQRIDARAKLDRAFLMTLRADAARMEEPHRQLAVLGLQMIASVEEANNAEAEARLVFLLYMLGAMLGLLALLASLLLTLVRRLSGKVDLTETERDNQRRVIDASPNPLLLCNADGAIFASNSAASRLLGSPVEDIVGNSIDDWIAETFPLTARSVAALRHPVEEARQVRLTLLRSDNLRCPVEVRSVIVPWGGDDEVLLVGLRDISNEVRLEANLQHARLEAAEGTAARARFVEALDHGIRTPLQGLLYAIELVEEDEKAGTGLALDHLALLTRTGKDVLRHAEDFLSQTTRESPARRGPPDADSAQTAVGDALRTVLVVEDHPINRALLCKVVTRAGHLAVSAADGETAVDLASARAFDLILMEINLPGLNGVDAARRIRASGGPSANARICAISAHTRLLDKPRLRAAGIDEILKKPVNSATIIACLDLAPMGPVEQPTSVDLETLSQATESLGKEEIATLLQGLFLEIEAILDTTDRWGRGEPAEALGNDAHSAAGLSAMLGLSGLSECLARLEHAVDDSDRDGALSSAALCRRLIPACREAVERAVALA